MSMVNLSMLMFKVFIIYPHAYDLSYLHKGVIYSMNLIFSAPLSLTMGNDVRSLRAQAGIVPRAWR